MDTQNAFTLMNAYDKWLKKCAIIKSHTLKVTQKGVWDSIKFISTLSCWDEVEYFG